MSIRREIYYKGFDGEWHMDVLSDNSIKVIFDPEGDEFGPGERTYELPEDITKIEHDDEYVFLTLKDKRIFQFKFEIDGAFIGDILDSDGEFIDTFACYSFWDNI